MLKNLLQIHLRLSQKPAEAAGDLIGNKIADKIRRVSKSFTTITVRNFFIMLNNLLQIHLKLF